MVPTALSPGAFVLLLLSVVLVLATVLTAFIVRLALSCSPTCSDTDDEAQECNAEERKPNSHRLNANDNQLVDTN